MANDIVNHDGTTTGVEPLGKIVVNTGGRGSHTYDTQEPAKMDEVTIADEAARYDARFDDPRYYTGDAPE